MGDWANGCFLTLFSNVNAWRISGADNVNGLIMAPDRPIEAPFHTKICSVTPLIYVKLIITWRRKIRPFIFTPVRMSSEIMARSRPFTHKPVMTVALNFWSYVVRPFCFLQTLFESRQPRGCTPTRTRSLGEPEHGRYGLTTIRESAGIVDWPNRGCRRERTQWQRSDLPPHGR